MATEIVAVDAHWDRIEGLKKRIDEGGFVTAYDAATVAAYETMILHMGLDYVRKVAEIAVDYFRSRNINQAGIRGDTVDMAVGNAVIMMNTYKHGQTS